MFRVSIRKFRVNKSGLCHVDIELRHNGRQSFIDTGFKVRPDQFRKGKVINHEAANEINEQIQIKLAELIKRSIRVQNKQILTATELKNIITQSDNAPDNLLKNTFEKRIDEAINSGSRSSKNLYEYSMRLLFEFSPGVNFEQITPGFLREYERWLKSEKVIKQNTIAIAMTYLRSVFNIALDNEQITNYPFRRFKIKRQKSEPKPLTIDQLRSIYSNDNFSNQLFMLSFFLIGMNMKDLLFLKKSDYNGERIIFDRFKTSRHYSIKVYPEAASIIDKFSGSMLLLNFMESRKDYIQFLKKINNSLPAGITSYMARYSWATIAASLGISRDIISHALGHGLSTVTDGYIDYNIELVDVSNLKVIEAVLNKKP